MELLQLPSFPIVFTFLLFLFMVATKHGRKKGTTNQNLSPKLPPGPWKLPFIGNLHLFIGSKLPHHCLRDLAKKYGSLMHLQLVEVSTIIVSSPQLAKEVMNNQDLVFANRPRSPSNSIMFYDSTDIAFSPYGGYWRQLRKICTRELLSVKSVRSFQVLREEAVSNLCRFIPTSVGSPLNLTNELLSLTNDIISMAAFGKKYKDKDAFLELSKEFISSLGGFTLTDTFPSLKLLPVITGMKPALERIHHKFDKILNNIIEDHRTNKKVTSESEEEDIVDVFLRYEEIGDLEFPMTTNNIKAVILDLFFGGTETSSSTTDWAMAELMRNPRVVEKAQVELRQVLKGKRKVGEEDSQELNYLDSVIKETLRLHPPLPLLLPRKNSEGCQIDGYDIPFKTRIIINAWAIGRDCEYWQDAENFNPERFQSNSIDFIGSNFAYIPLGSGRRICPGMVFALANVKLQLAQLLYHFNWKFANGISPDDLDMDETFGLAVRRRNDLYLIATPCVPLINE